MKKRSDTNTAHWL